MLTSHSPSLLPSDSISKLLIGASTKAMDRQNKGPFIRRNEKYEITWIVHIENLSDLSPSICSPKFQTAENVDFKIILFPGLFFGADDVFCTLTRLLDSGPSEVHYAASCKVFIGKERPEDRNGKMQPLEDKTFRQGSTLIFQLLPLSDVRKSVAAHLSSEPVKLILQIRLQRKSFGSLRLMNSLFVYDELKIFSFSKNRLYDNKFYEGKENEYIPEEKDESKNIPKDMDANYVGVCLFDRETSPWLQTFHEMNLPNCMIKCQMHILDVNGVILSSSQTRMMGIGQFTYRFQVMKMEQVRKNMKILSQDGEISILSESSGGCNVKPENVYKKWAFAFPCRNVSNLRNDLKQLRQNCSKGTNLKIRADGQVFGIHREIVVARSPTFKAMLSSSMAEKLSNVVDMKDVDSETLNSFLSYIYWGAFDYSLECEDACSLYAIAAKYFVDSLKRACSRQLASCSSCEKLSAVASLFDDHELQYAVDSFNSLDSNDYAVFVYGSESLSEEGLVSVTEF